MIKVNENTCIGCGACMAIAPENFDFSDAGLSTVISQEVTDATHEAAGSCPVGAISIEATKEVENTIEEVVETESKVIDFPTSTDEEVEEKAA